MACCPASAKKQRSGIERTPGLGYPSTTEREQERPILTYGLVSRARYRRNSLRLLRITSYLWRFPGLYIPKRKKGNWRDRLSIMGSVSYDLVPRLGQRVHWNGVRLLKIFPTLMEGTWKISLRDKKGTREAGSHLWHAVFYERPTESLQYDSKGH